MNLSWRFERGVPPGGTVLSIAGEDEDLWVGSAAGLFHRHGGKWKPVISGIPFVRVNVVSRVENVLYAAGLPIGIIRSINDGESWQKCITDQIHTPITCIAASPDFQRDGVLLAGTSGDGLLRSTDAGRSWRLSNFGLRNFSIFTLASAPSWERRQYIYAGTDHGVYQSPNGGRAWRLAGLDEHSVLTLAVHPDFHINGLLVAGTDDGSIFRSTDGGRNWVNVAGDLYGEAGISAIRFVPDGKLWLCTDDGGVYVSQDNGESWNKVYHAPESALTLEVLGMRIYLGLQNRGVFQSENGGESWDELDGLSARRFNWLRFAPPYQFAVGVYEDVWVSEPEKTQFTQSGMFEGLSIITDVASSGDLLFLSRPDGIWAFDPSEGAFAQILEAREAVLAITASETKIWAGGEFGSLWSRESEQTGWTRQTTPFGGEFPVASLLCLPGQQGSSTLIAALGSRRKSIIRLMRSQDGGNQWEPLLEAQGDWRQLRISAQDDGDGRILLATGTTCYWLKKDAWKKVELTRPQSPITAVLVVPETDLMLAATGEKLYRKQGSSEWQAFDQGIEGQALVDLCASIRFSEGRKLFALTLDGRIYSCEL